MPSGAIDTNDDFNYSELLKIVDAVNTPKNGKQAADD